MKLLPELVINKIFEQTFVIFVSNKSTYLEQNLLDQSRLIVLPNLDCHHDRYRDLGWNNETFLVDFQPQKWPKILFRLHNHHNLNQDPLMILNDPDSGKLLCHSIEHWTLILEFRKYMYMARFFYYVFLGYNNNIWGF